MGWESEKKKATKVIFGSRLKRKTGEKNVRVTTAIMLYENDKLDEEDVLETFHQTEVHNDFVNLIFVWTIFRQNFVVDEQPTSFSST